MGNLVVILILAVVLFSAARKVYRDKKSGKTCSCGGSCSGSCGNCSMSCSQRKNGPQQGDTKSE